MFMRAGLQKMTVNGESCSTLSVRAHLMERLVRSLHQTQPHHRWDGSMTIGTVQTRRRALGDWVVENSPQHRMMTRGMRTTCLRGPVRRLNSTFCLTVVLSFTCNKVIETHSVFYLGPCVVAHPLLPAAIAGNDMPACVVSPFSPLR